MQTDASWDLQCIVGRIQPIIFVNHVKCACVAPIMLGELCKRIQHCCATLRRSDRTKEMLGVVGSDV